MLFDKDRDSGQLIVVYCPNNATVSPDAYGPCPQCLGYYELRQLWKHSNTRCLHKSNADELRTFVKRSRYLLPVPDYLRETTRTVLNAMHRDEVYRAVISDDLIMQYAQKTTSKH